LCNGKWCSYCKQAVEFEHKCYILTEDEKKLSKKKKLNGFFYYEAMQVESNRVANLAVARKICTSCLDKDKCVKNCGDYIFETNDEFCEWLFGSDKKDSIAIAHNMKSSDGYFIMNYIMNNITPEDKMPKCILNGSKLLVIDFNGIKIIDYINFIPMALAKFPKTFGLSELKKGYFPHFFNILKNQNYKSPYPPPEDNGAEFMSVEDNMTFIK
jgi:hypothetical protein